MNIYQLNTYLRGLSGVWPLNLFKRPFLREPTKNGKGQMADMYETYFLEATWEGITFDKIVNFYMASRSQ